MKLSKIVCAAVVAASCGGSVDAQRTPPADPPASASAPAVQPAPVQALTPSPEPRVKGTTGEQAVKSPTGEQAAPRVNPDAATLADFKARIDKYLALRKQAVKDAPRLKETKDPAQIKAAQDGMASSIRAARADAKHGDIFTPEIAAKFRRLLSPELKGDDGRDAKAIIKDDAPVNIPFKVNAKYPEGASVPTVPANLLVNLPTLPEPLQYRIIDRHIILVDEDADVIVDYALNVIR